MEAIRSFLKGTLSGKLWNGYKIELLARQLYFIGVGIKCGLVWDINSFSARATNDLLNQLKLENLVEESLVVFEIGEDFGIFDTKRLEGLCCDNFCFVNISKHLSCPEIIENLSASHYSISELLNLIYLQFESIDKKQSVLLNFVLENVCSPTIFGILIGYPIVYWYDMSRSDENCLAGVPLEVFQAGMNSGEQTQFIPTVSFSIPGCVVSSSTEARGKLEAWKRTVIDNGFKFTHFVKTLDDIVL